MGWACRQSEVSRLREENRALREELDRMIASGHAEWQQAWKAALSRREKAE